MKSKFGQFGPVDDEYVCAFRDHSDMPNLQVWRGMAQSKGKIDYSKDFYYIDTGYFNGFDGTKHKEWHRITKNNYQTLGHYGVDVLHNDTYCMKKFRKIFTVGFEEFKPGMLLSGIAAKGRLWQSKPWKKRYSDSKNILIIEPSLKVFQHYGIDSKEWTKSVVKDLKKYTGKKVIFRSKPNRQERMSTNTLDDQLIRDEIFCTITFASVAGLHSVMAGVPSIVLGPSASDFLSNKKIRDIINPIFPDEDKIKNHLLYLANCQFNIEEIYNGKAWHYVNELQGENKYEANKGLVFTGE